MAFQFGNASTATNMQLHGSLNYVAGTGTAAVTTSPYCYSKWVATTDYLGTTPENGMMLFYKIPVAGHGTYGTCLALSDGTNTGTYHPVVGHSLNSMISTRYSVNQIVLMVYNSSVSCSVYSNSASSAAISGCWVVVNDYDSGNSYDRILASYDRRYAGSQITSYKICGVDALGKLQPLTIDAGSSTLITNKAVNKTEIRPDKFYYYASTTTKNTGALLDNVLYSIIPHTACRYTFNADVATYQDLYLCGQIQSNGMFKLATVTPGTETESTTAFLVQVPKNASSLDLNSYFTEGYQYIYLGGSYSTVNYMQLYDNHPIYFFDGTNLMPYYRSSSIEADTIKATKLSIPTTSEGTTYGAGTSGQVLKTNGTSIYWSDDVDTNTWRPLGTGADQAAAGNHTHDYLPLSGGTLSGNLSILPTGNGALAIGTSGTGASSSITIGTAGTTTFPAIYLNGKSKNNTNVQLRSFINSSNNYMGLYCTNSQGTTAYNHSLIGTNLDTAASNTPTVNVAGSNAILNLGSASIIQINGSNCHSEVYNTRTGDISTSDTSRTTFATLTLPSKGLYLVFGRVNVWNVAIPWSLYMTADSLSGTVLGFHQNGTGNNYAQVTGYISTTTAPRTIYLSACRAGSTASAKQDFGFWYVRIR